MILESIFFKSTIACTLIKLFFNRYNLNRLSNQKSYFFFYFFHILFFWPVRLAVRVIMIFILFWLSQSKKNSPISLINYLTTNLLASRNKRKYQGEGEEGITMLPALNFGKKRPNLDSIPAKIGNANW